MSETTHTDFELEQYLQELYHEVNSLVYADEDGASKENKFTEYVMNLLAEAEETEGVMLCPYQQENKWENIQFKINGYAIEEGYETLDVFITHFQDTYNIYKVSKPDLDKLIKWSTGFLNSAFKGYLEDIEQSTEAYNLAKLIRDNHNKFVRVNVFILSNGNIPYDPPQDFKLKSFDDLIFNFHVWDAERLHRLSISKNNREPIEIDFEGKMGTVIPCLAMPSNNDLYECYLAIVPGTVLSALYSNYGTRLLESNVRAFLQQTGKINKGIRDTIREKPFMFLPYNNGLATTALEVKTKTLENGQLVISAVKDFQIVNGGQTTASIFHTEKKFKKDISEVFVQMKLTVIKDIEKKNEAVPFISRYANSQNKVSELDLTSNNPVLQKLEELSRTTFAIDPNDRNKQTLWFFERVKGQYKEAINKEPTPGKKDAFEIKYPRNQVIIKSEVAKYMNTWLLKPFHVAKGAEKNYNFFLKEIEKDFKNKQPNRIFWQDIVANAILFKNTDSLFGRKDRDAIGDTNIKSHTVSYALSYFHYITNNRLNLGKIWELQSIPDDLQKELKKCLIFVYDFFVSMNVGLISETAKSEKTWELLKGSIKQIINQSVVSKYLISASDFKKRYSDSDNDIEETKKYNELQKITSLGIRFWDGLTIYMEKTELLSTVKKNYVSSIRGKLKRNGNFTESEISNGVEIIEKLVSEKTNFDKISALSKLQDKEIIDASSLYNRLKLLDGDAWKRAIDIGEQTKTLNFNEISVIKTVIQKLKKQETIDLKRLEIVQNALKKIKKFGFKS